ncbi:MAG: hypothetical protein CM1200mP11_2710 [Nitrosopumilaceae archaeon]|nr:MAG: hypothetical protein CM1200mP11_2710 [Nitrosopumilaceae archaeon]
MYNNETRRKADCIILPTSKLGVEVLKTLQKDGYIGEFEHIDDKRGGKFKIKLLAKITKWVQFHQDSKKKMMNIILGTTILTII